MRMSETVQGGGGEVPIALGVSKSSVSDLQIVRDERTATEQDSKSTGWVLLTCFLCQFPKLGSFLSSIGEFRFDGLDSLTVWSYLGQ